MRFVGVLLSQELLDRHRLRMIDQQPAVGEVGWPERPVEAAAVHQGADANADAAALARPLVYCLQLCLSRILDVRFWRKLCRSGHGIATSIQTLQDFCNSQFLLELRIILIWPVASCLSQCGVSGMALAAPAGNKTWLDARFRTLASLEGDKVIIDTVSRMRRHGCLGGPTTNGDDAGLRVLVVEDERDTTASMAPLLRQFGHRVQTAPDGPTALQAAQAEPPDVVLLDIGLPGTDGCQVARQLWEKTATRRPLLIAVTGHGQKPDRHRLHEAGIYLHLVKPIDPAFLCRVLKRFQTILMPDNFGSQRLQPYLALA